jgi:AraC-like DNA-binding protein
VILIWFTFYKYNQKLKQRILHANQYYLIRNWLLIFCSFLSFAAVLISLGVYNVVTLQNKDLFLQNYYNSLLLLSFSFLLLNLALLMCPQILYGLPIERLAGNGISTPQELNNELLTHLKNESQDHEDKRIPSFYSTDYLTQIGLCIGEAKDNFLFLDSDFNMEQISEQSGIPLHHLAYYFSNIHPSKFVEWRNSLRVQHSIKLIEDGSLGDHSFEGVAIQCGFSSRHTFLRAFKSITGKTPSEYFKSK